MTKRYINMCVKDCPFNGVSISSRCSVVVKIESSLSIYPRQVVFSSFYNTTKKGYDREEERGGYYVLYYKFLSLIFLRRKKLTWKMQKLSDLRHYGIIWKNRIPFTQNVHEIWQSHANLIKLFIVTKYPVKQQLVPQTLYTQCNMLIIKEGVGDCCVTSTQQFSAILWREQVNFQVHFILDQYL